MRLLKIAALVSFTMFCLAGTWVLLADYLPSVRPAMAQTTGVYPGPPIAYIQHLDIDRFAVLDVDGYYWMGTWQGTAAGWNRVGQMFAPGTPIPTGTESLGAIKGAFKR